MTADAPSRKRAAVADPAAQKFLRSADPVLAQLIDARPDFRPRAWMDDLPPLDAFGTLVFQVVGQQLSVAATRTIVSRIEDRFGGRLPTPAELLAVDPQVLRSAGLSAGSSSVISTSGATRLLLTLSSVSHSPVGAGPGAARINFQREDEVVSLCHSGHRPTEVDPRR